jgi:hypothetical protein
MSDGASCACLRVEYKTFANADGTVWGHWACQSCGSQFIPTRFAEHQQREALARLDGPGTVSARFKLLMDELEKRFPHPDKYLSSEVPEAYYLRAIDISCGWE